MRLFPSSPKHLVEICRASACFLSRAQVVKIDWRRINRVVGNFPFFLPSRLQSFSFPLLVASQRKGMSCGSPHGTCREVILLWDVSGHAAERLAHAPAGRDTRGTSSFMTSNKARKYLESSADLIQRVSRENSSTNGRMSGLFLLNYASSLIRRCLCLTLQLEMSQYQTFGSWLQHRWNPMILDTNSWPRLKTRRGRRHTWFKTKGDIHFNIFCYFT